MPPAKVREFYSKNRDYKVVVVPSSASMRTEGKGPELEVEKPSQAQELAVAPAFLAGKLPAGEKPRAHFFKRRLVGGEYDRVSDFELPNRNAPAWCFVADDGRSFLTQGEWFKAQTIPDLALYRLPQGKLVAGHKTAALFGEAVDKTWASAEHGSWAEHAFFKFEWVEGQVERFVAWTDWGQRLSVNLSNGYPETHWEDSRLRPEYMSDAKAWEAYDGAKSERWRTQMLIWLRDHGAEASLPRLKKLVETWEKPTWWYALRAYRGAGGRKAVPYLLKLFKEDQRREVRMSAADGVSMVYWSEWHERNIQLPPDPGVVETLKAAILFDRDDDLRQDLIGSFCHHFYPRLPDTMGFLRSAARTEKNGKVKAQMEHWAEHMEKMYSAAKP